MQYTLTFPGGEVQYHLNSSFGALDNLIDTKNCVLLTDTNIAGIYPHLLAGHKTIIIPAGEANKTIETAQYITEQLIYHEAHKKTFLVGIGGGMVTDITGFVAGIYMRSIPFGFIPTTLLGMVDAAIGGKNGVNTGPYKNFLGTIRQPQFILYMPSFLQTLPIEEWSNGFAEVIKYACLFDAALFEELEQHDLAYYQQNAEALSAVIAKCADWKNKIVLADEHEKNERKLLNFGHTAGHAFETLYHLPHGYAVGLGMIVACIVSENINGLDKNIRKRLTDLLQRYQLPVKLQYNIAEVMQVLKMDKKRSAGSIDYITLESIGKGNISNIGFDSIEKALVKFTDAGDH